MNAQESKQESERERGKKSERAESYSSLSGAVIVCCSIFNCFEDRFSYVLVIRQFLWLHYIFFFHFFPKIKIIIKTCRIGAPLTSCTVCWKWIYFYLNIPEYFNYYMTAINGVHIKYSVTRHETLNYFFYIVSHNSLNIDNMNCTNNGNSDRFNHLKGLETLRSIRNYNILCNNCHFVVILIKKNYKPLCRITVWLLRLVFIVNLHQKWKKNSAKISINISAILSF